MTAPAVSCEVIVDGQRIADTAAEYEQSIPTVLDGLSMTWGRDGVMDQPDPSSLTFTVRDRDNDADFLRLLHVGRPVEVWAASRVETGEAPVDVAVDGNFNDSTIPVADRVSVFGGSASYDPIGGTSSLRIAQTSFAPTYTFDPAKPGTPLFDRLPVPRPDPARTLGIQSFAFDDDNARMYTLLGSNGAAGDLYLGWLDLANGGARQAEFMTLLGFGHGQSMGVEVQGSQTFIWMECDAQPDPNGNAYGTKICRFPWVPNTTLTSATSADVEKFDLRPGSVNNLCAVDMEHRRVLHRWVLEGARRLAVYSLDDLLAAGAGAAPLAPPIDQVALTLTWQGLTYFGDFAYFLTGDARNPQCATPVPDTRIWWQNVWSGASGWAINRTATDLPRREPEGMAVQSVGAARRLVWSFDTRANCTSGTHMVSFFWLPVATSDPNPKGVCQGFLPVAPHSDDATAWDAIPTAQPGETWTLRLGVVAGRAAGCIVQAAIFDAPWRRDQTPRPFGTPYLVEVEEMGTAELEVQIPSNAPRGWLGFVFTLTVQAWQDTPRTWADLAAIEFGGGGTWAGWPVLLLPRFEVLAPATAERRVLVYGGRITDLAAQAKGNGVSVDVTSVDYTADLANDYVGDDPWLVQTVAQRVQTIRNLATRPFVIDVDPRPGVPRVSWRDVDSQPVLTLLGELASSGDGVLWSAEHATLGTYLWVEDPLARISLGLLRWDAGRALVVIAGNTRPSEGVVLSACDVLRDPVQFTSSVTDVVTRVNLTWQDQTVDDGGQPAPTERTTTVIDATAESPTGSDLGVRALGYTTQLITAADATAIAWLILARSRSTGWRAESLTWDTDLPEVLSSAYRTAALDLLDGTHRLGLPLAITDMPHWSPSGPVFDAYVEGGTWNYQSGRWIFEANISPTGATGDSVAWNELDVAWAWEEFDPAITWWSLRGVGSIVDSPPWTAITHAWAQDTKTWQDYYGPQTR